MARRHPSTAAERVPWVSRLIAERGTYGLVSDLSREADASRQTLYAWAARGVRALEAAFTPAASPLSIPAELSRRVLTLLVETHPAERGIQAALRELTGQRVGLGTISAIVRDAERRAVQIQATLAPPTARAIALDELYGNNRRGAYLHVVDTLSHAVWAAEGPLAVDADSWTLVLWAAQGRGLRWHATSSDGGGAMATALGVVDPEGQHGRDAWHVLRRCAQVQGRLDRWVAESTEQTAAGARQAARGAAGQRPRSDVAAHAAEVAQAAPTRQRAQVQRLHRHLLAARPGLLAFVPALDAVQRAAAREIGEDGVGLLAWAWQRRAILGPAPDDLVAQLPAAWRPAARRLLAAWAGAVRASSAVENGHSILRPHLAVQRTLSPGRLALLTVWHNHRVFTRGARAGFSPLQLSGITDAPTDWLVALGYPPAPAPANLTACPTTTPSPPAWPLAA